MSGQLQAGGKKLLTSQFGLMGSSLMKIQAWRRGRGCANLQPMSHAASYSFQTTRWTHVAQLREGTDETERDRILAELCRAYWFPLYGYARRAGRSPQDSEDLTQGFFAHALRSDLFAKAQQARGKMRNFLLTSFQHHVTNVHSRDAAARRGGSAPRLSLDALQAEDRYRDEPADLATPEALFNRRWARDFFVSVGGQLRLEMEAAGKSAACAVLQPWLFVEGYAEAYAEAARTLGVTEGNFRVMVSRYRKRYRELFREAVADTLDSPTEAEIDAETRELIQLGTS